MLNCLNYLFESIFPPVKDKNPSKNIAINHLFLNCVKVILSFIREISICLINMASQK